MVAVGFLVLLIATVFQGSFGICFKKYQPFSWEAFWALFSIIGVLLMPHIWCAILVPDYFSYLASTPMTTLVTGAACGFFWGISSIWYSLAINYIGVSLVTGINLGLSNLLGSLIPMFVLGTFPSMSSLILLLVGQAILLGGVAVLSKAGFMKNDTVKVEDKQDAKSKTKSLFMVGFIMALASGAGSAAINIGGSFSNYPVNLATEAGVTPMYANLLQWPVVFFGGFLANFGYAVYKLIKNKTYTDYTKPGCAKAYGKVLLTSFVWFAALGVYAMATALLGSFGPVVGWVAFNGLALIIANLWGFKDGEWKGHPKARNVALIGNAVIIVSLFVVGIANGMA
ncbi:L-rhamnose/proton symporter RhaT [Bifidobacterium oedipodis]|uniref:Sugar:proton symporter n=1 Tax=Bifidobacterium oedipodis TaxID=2675322 RepID=A0A7Y0EQE1_9BIFI|nr:L-rhamnose/proton symporter RhaT [Bifidobacterium sp. DSM 109957]NMM94538.1 sugar:proton symporter [Bifidobacterium sp. DSM 109957]